MGIERMCLGIKVVFYEKILENVMYLVQEVLAPSGSSPQDCLSKHSQTLDLKLFRRVEAVPVLVQLLFYQLLQIVHLVVVSMEHIECDVSGVQGVNVVFHRLIFGHKMKMHFSKISYQIWILKPEGKKIIDILLAHFVL